MGQTKISINLDENIKHYRELFKDCDDIKMKEMKLGNTRRGFLSYIEVAVSNMLLENTALGRLLASLSQLPDEEFQPGAGSECPWNFRCDTL